MSRIFALVSVATMLLIGSAAFGASYESSSANSTVQTQMVELLGTGLDIGSLIPLILLAGLMMAVLGVLAR
jgi:hypothetical protein